MKPQIPFSLLPVKYLLPPATAAAPGPFLGATLPGWRGARSAREPDLWAAAASSGVLAVFRGTG